MFATTVPVATPVTVPTTTATATATAMFRDVFIDDGMNNIISRELRRMRDHDAFGGFVGRLFEAERETGITSGNKDLIAWYNWKKSVEFPEQLLASICNKYMTSVCVGNGGTWVRLDEDEVKCFHALKYHFAEKTI